MLRWVYTGRMVVATAIFLAALAQWQPWAPEVSNDTAVVLATLALAGATLVTALGLWWVEFLGREPGRNFLYGQVIFDTLLVTVIIHVTQGVESPFAPLYILVIAAAALLVPLPGGMLVGALASILYLADLVYLHPTLRDFSEDLGNDALTAFLRIGLFVVIAVVTAALGDRLRRTGSVLGVVESELRQLRLDTNDVLAAIDTGLLTMDGAGRLVHVNGAAIELLGLSAEEWRGRAVPDELDRLAPGLGTLVRRTASTRVPVSRYEIRRRVTEGDRYLGVRTTLLEREGVPWVTAVIQDITEGKQIEDLIRRAERLQAVAELGASLAHEIRNPLASIRSAVEQLAANRLNTADREVLRRLVVLESERLSRLLAEFMEFSQVEMRRWTSVDIGEVATQAIDLVIQHPDRGAETEVRLLRPQRPLIVDGDHDLLHRAVFNLVLNAVQHIGDRGTVTVELDQVVGRDLPPSVQLDAPICMTVRDTGPGIREEDIPRLFDPFYTTREGGTGLGLALVHRAVEAHRGTILVDGAHGGARFTVYLPAHVARETVNGTHTA